MSYKYSLKLRLVKHPDVFLGGYGAYLSASEDKKTLTMKVRGTDRTFQQTPYNEREYQLVDDVGDNSRSIELVILDTLHIKKNIEIQEKVFDIELVASITCPDGSEYSLTTLTVGKDKLYSIAANNKAFENTQYIVHDQYRPDDDGIQWVYSNERLTKENYSTMLFNLASLRNNEHYPPVDFDSLKPRVIIPCCSEYFVEVASFINTLLPEGFHGTLVDEVCETKPLSSTDIVVSFSHKLSASSGDETKEYVINGLYNIDGYKMEVLAMTYNHKEHSVDYKVMLRRRSRVHAIYAIFNHFRNKEHLSLHSIEFVLEDKHNKVTFVLHGSNLNRVKVIKERNPDTFGKQHAPLNHVAYVHDDNGTNYLSIDPEENNEPGKVVFNIRRQKPNNTMKSTELPLETYISTSPDSISYWMMYMRGIFQLAGVRSVEPHWVNSF